VTPIVSVVGRSGSGKTTLLEKLIRELTARGRRIGTVKHHVHGRVQVDVPGKDSWRHRQAGAVAVSLSSHAELILIRDVPAEVSLPVIAHRLLFDVDLILTEGFRSAGMPVIEVSRKALDVPLLCGRGEPLVAVVADWPTGSAVPQFGLDDVSALADFLEQRFLGRPATRRLALVVDGRAVTLPPQAEALVVQAVTEAVGPVSGPVELRLTAERAAP
jgi:molybdopterin-guanine dinucleotide biosynthesis protein B